MITYLPPILTGFLIGAIQGLNFFLILLLSHHYLKHLESSDKYQMIIVVMIVLLSLICANVIGEIGTTFNDLTLSSLVILALLICTQTLMNNEELAGNWHKIFIAGICWGTSSTGFKLTMAIYGLGATIGFLFLNKDFKTKIQLLMVFVLGMTLGFLVINGYWMILLWQAFKNPIFPLYNKIFKSPYYYDFNMHTYYGPKKIFETIFYPFYFSWNRKVGHSSVHDLRIAIVYLLLVILLIKKLWLFRNFRGLGGFCRQIKRSEASRVSHCRKKPPRPRKFRKSQNFLKGKKNS